MWKLVVLILIFASGARPAPAQTQVSQLELTPVSLATTTDQTPVPYYVLELPAVQVPAGKMLAEAYVEFLLDVTATLASELTSGVVTLEVFPLPSATSGKLDVAHLERSTMKRSVAIGTDRRVRIYITEFVRRIAVDKAASRRLIVGSVSGDRTARFAAKAQSGSETKATLTVHFRQVEEPRVSPGS